MRMDKDLAEFLGFIGGMCLLVIMVAITYGIVNAIVKAG